MATKTAIAQRKTAALDIITNEANAMAQKLNAEPLSLPRRARDETMLQVIQLELLAKLMTQLNSQTDGVLDKHDNLIGQVTVLVDELADAKDIPDEPAPEVKQPTKRSKAKAS